jgi:hypothetical protein
LGYDADLRTTSATATWGSGSGSSGTTFSQGLTYDADLVSLATTQAAVPGQSGSGGSETQNFCYDEQNRLLWAGNSGTQPGAGNGTCGSGTLSNTLSGASYSNSFIYTHLGQLWQGPLNGGSTQYQYLYCSSSQPHQLTGLYPTGTTCSNKSGQVYTSSYDAFGNVTSRFYSGTTAALSYDALDHFTQWNAGSNNFEQYVYDASRERVLRRSTNGSGTSMTVYAFGLEDHSYSSSGSNTGNTYYYSLAGRLLGKSDGTNTTFYLVDALGTPQASFSNVANSAALKGNQVYGPYGKQRYHQGTIGTPRDFTGQYNDSLRSFSFQQYLKSGPQHSPVKSGPPSPYPQPPKQTPNPGAKPTTPPPSAEPATMKPLNQSLSSAFLTGSAGVSAFDLKGSDGRLEVQLQPGSLDLTQAKIAGGKAPNGALTLQVTQISGHFEAILNQLGTYQLQVVDSQGHVVNGVKLRTPVTIIYHYTMSEMLSLNLDPAHILLSWPTLIASAQQAKQPTTTLSSIMHNDPATHTLTAQSSLFGPGPLILHNDGQNQMAPSPHLAEVQGNNGQLSYSYPLQVVPGSGGIAPQLELDYSSMDPNSRHSITSPASDEGDGFSLGLGSITSQVYPNSGVTWYFINGIGNVSDRLIEYDTTNKLFYTEHLSYLRIQQVTVGGQPCFNVWDKSGTFYEVGCTGDSLEYYMPNGTRENYQWNVDRIIAPSEGPQGTDSAGWRIILVSYLQDCGSTYSPTQTCVANNAAIRDSVIKQITYGYNSSFGSLTSLDGVAGTVDFTYLAPFSYSSGGVNWATTYTYGTSGNDPCSNPPTTPTLRCDDPIQKSGGFTAPDVLGTFSLATATSYLNTDSSVNNAAYGYAFTYNDTPFRSCTDPISGMSGYCAGEHVLTKITPTVYQTGTAHTLRATTFSYSPAPGATGALNDTYYDSIAGGTPFSATTTWQYLISYQDLNTGIGESMTYSLAYNNSDGTPTIENGQQQVTDDRFDALYCSSNANNPNTSLRCFQGNYQHPDDHAWSVQVVTSVTSSGKDSSALGQAVTTYNYYRLANTYPYTHQSGSVWCYPDQLTPVVEQQCVGDNWFASGDTDWGDYYHAEFRGFAEAFQTSPAGDLTVSFYFSTEGWNRPSTDQQDYDGGQLQVQEVYQGGSQSSNKLLSKTLNIYPGPYPQNGDAPQNTTTNGSACYTPTGSSPYAACDIIPLSSKTTEYDETNSSNAPWVEHDYTYDDYDPTNGLKSGYHNLTQEVISGSNLPNATPNLIYPLTEKWSYATNASLPGATGWIYYNVDHVSHSEIDDASGHALQCQYTSYDEGKSNPTPTAGLPTTVKTYTSGNCANQTTPTITTTYTMYDAYGNTVATVDANGAATPTLYNSTGCTTTSTIEIANSAWNKGKYTSCANYDTAHYEALPTSTTNALSQSTSFTYDANQGNALTQSQDPNSQVTKNAYSYDGSGNSTVQVTVPPDSSNFTNQTSSYSTCTSSSTLPCYEVDKLSFQYNSNAALSGTFYDSLGRAVETSTPFPAPANAPPNTNYYTIVFTSYNDGNHSTYQSEPFVVAVPSSTHGSGYIDPNNAKDYLNNTVYGTGTYFDALAACWRYAIRSTTRIWPPVLPVPRSFPGTIQPARTTQSGR